MPMAPRTPLPTKFAVAEKHTSRLLPPFEDCTDHRIVQSVFMMRRSDSRPMSPQAACGLRSEEAGHDAICGLSTMKAPRTQHPFSTTHILPLRGKYSPAKWPYISAWIASQREQEPLKGRCQKCYSGQNACRNRASSAAVTAGGRRSARTSLSSASKYRLLFQHESLRSAPGRRRHHARGADRKSTRLNSSHLGISY